MLLSNLAERDQPFPNRRPTAFQPPLLLLSKRDLRLALTCKGERPLDEGEFDALWQMVSDRCVWALMVGDLRLALTCQGERPLDEGEFEALWRMVSDRSEGSDRSGRSFGQGK